MSPVRLVADHFGPSQSGQPLIILHGLFGAARNWSALAKRFARHRPVHVLDLRNHGRSPHVATMNYRLMATDIARYMKEQELEETDLLGHSMGGKVAMTLALEHPQKITRLVVADIAPTAYLPEARGFESYIDAMAAVPMAALARRAEVGDHLKAAVPDPAIRAFLLGNVEAATTGLRWTINLSAIRAALPEIYGWPTFDQHQFDGPTLFLRGADSNYVQPEHRTAIKALFPSARHASLSKAGHWLHADQPEAFLASVTAFLDAT